MGNYCQRPTYSCRCYASYKYVGQLGTHIPLTIHTKCLLSLLSNKFTQCFPFDYTAVAVSGKVGP